jgi:hypothetical protein
LGKQKKEGCRALPLYDIPVSAAFIRSWISPPLSKSDMNQPSPSARSNKNK